MELIHQLFYRNLDVVFFIYGFAFVTMGVTVLVQPKKGSEFEIANILWLLAAFGITHGINELLDMWAIIKGRHHILDLARWFILVVSYIFLFEFGRQLFRLNSSKSTKWKKKVSSLLQWWLLPVLVIFIFISGVLSPDFWNTGSIWTRYLLGLPGGLLIGFGFRMYYYHEKSTLTPLKVKKYFLFGGTSFLIYGILGGIIVPKGNFFPSNWLNTETFLVNVKIPVQGFRTVCAIVATWAIGGMLTIFHWEIRNRLQNNQLMLRQQLRQSEARYMEVVERSTDIIYSIDTDGYIISSNRQGYKLLGYDLQELIGKLFKEVCSAETFSSLETRLEQIQREGSVFLGDGHLMKKSGERLDISTHSIAMYDSKKNILGVRLIIRDITEHKKMEEEFQKIEKLESVGIMAGGIAHDFNNILTTIAGNISLAKASSTDNKKLAAILKDAQKACVHAKNLTKQLLIFSAGGSPIKEVTDIKPLLYDSAHFALRGSPINCEMSIAKDLWPVEIDEGQIIQVIHNLVLNAQQAMPDGGTIKVIAKNVSEEEKDASPLQGKKHIVFSVEDHGPGIPKDIINKIFDPFFTTKQKGSGLGLACTHSIIFNHDGHISVNSEGGNGSTFNIYLPVLKETAPYENRKEDIVIKGAGHILLMDDEKSVRRSVVKMLNYIGYKAETAKNGEEAIELYSKAKSSPDPFDAVIIDLTIRGGMGGKDAIKALIEIDPDVRAIVSSGYFNDPIMADFKQYGFSGVIPKPYEIEALGELLQKVIKG